MRTLLLLLSLLIIGSQAFAGKISGRITDDKNQPLPFSSVTIKGTTQGTTANNAGSFAMVVSEGTYTLVVQHIGYKTTEKKVVVGNDEVVVNFELSEQRYELGNVIVKQGEDPAYAIIRNAIKKRKFYETELKKFETEVYIKGQMRTRNYPKKFLGKDVDFEDGDTSKRKIVFLSETVAKYSVDEPKKKVEVISTKVSGDKDAFGFGSPQIFSFYQNNIYFGSLNPRGFISPVSNNALNYYKYKFEGSFFENNQMINRIKVTPKRKYEPLFNGYINIIENEWRIQSVQLVLYKENQMQFVDTLRIEQLYVPYKQMWLIKQQTISPAINLLGFEMVGTFVQVYDKFNLQPVFAKGFFDNTILKYYDSSNKKPATYWDSVRPVPLLQEEVKDYQKKDSLEQVKKDPHYLDSVDRRRNKLKVVSLLLTGQTFSKEKAKQSFSLEPLIDAINFNTVEGAVINYSVRYSKRFTDVGRKSLSIVPTVRYGFSNHHFNADLKTSYTFGKKFFSNVAISGGKRVFQFDNSNPISPQYNTISTLQYEHNYLKIYEAWYSRISYNKEIGSGFTIGANAQYQDRIPLQNTTSTKWRDFEDRSFTPNFTFAPHQAVIASVNVRWKPGTQYIEFPDQKLNVGSRFPTFNLSYTQGVKGALGSDVDYSKWRFSVNDNVNLKLYGSLDYNVAIGGFLKTTAAFLPDYQHYTGNQLTVTFHDLNTFQLMPYYAYSNVEKLYSTAHIQYHLNGLLTNKIPLFKKLNWFIVGGTNMLFLKSGTKYIETFVGLENILKILRIDYVKSFTNNDNGTTGIRISLPFFGGRE
ncbi:DUF5686 and carboxypeptidase regulatory-like domain-containing protein [Segetibacter aerophilus]|uniref:Membrane protein n=1 Tax=Segetibacter aerophilus TaxID=670293 RepID=A0A512BDJ7_9BACT|nr:DUF5686 and carboxypeptidase regulatory-like domain-containing protein [Segetibacter aerophilus]GEO10036.1 membrane protein [Segetibacter aerophilus]